ncbi:long-chain fatty acid--CoA ligase [candidate division KSB3 bacterium]|uniref:Long-chain fatty acid--CoA ligase n=1 Tax=candidate division KSB3 bacterium TaxID=2044937 RepID=A0A2G6E560_9BACT|nr:MAG: long-chain fatty acid--CoA ligase [candidate division KSB3 bacterium]PIE29768.1 MAG: long-chain fatty acid--CoA ligase [candidate division KSB3 bacterium]
MKLLQVHDKVACVGKDFQCSYAELLEQVHRYAGVFSEDSCSKIAIFSENRIEWVYALYAGWKNGSTVVPIDFMAPPDEVRYILEDCRPQILFASRENAAELRDMLTQLSYDLTLLIFEDLGTQLEAIDPEIASTFLEREKDDTAMIIYTSGTTGSPKGVMISFDNIAANAESISEDVKIYTPEQRVLILLPLHHVYPLMGTLIVPLYVGATCVFSPSMASEDIMATLQNHEVTLFLGVPRLFHLIRKNIKEKIEAHWLTRSLFKVAESLDSPAFSRMVFKKVHQRFGGKIQHMPCGGAAIDPDVARDYKTLGFDLLTGYGMTEAAPLISFTHPGAWKSGASGQVLANNEVRIIDGEITIKGRNVMQGYYNRPEESAEVIRDGWLHTGDLGYVDAENFLFVTGRKKEIIVLPNGKNINPMEIERKILDDYPVVKEIGVCMLDGLLHAVVYPNFSVMQEHGIHHIEEYIRWDVLDPYNHSVSPAKKILKFTIVKEELPKTRLGKLRRFQLPDITKKDRPDSGPIEEPDFQEYRLLKEFLQKQTDQPISPSDHIEIDLGLDSLDKISFLTFLKSTFGVELKDDELMHHFTVQQLAEHIRERKVKIETEGVNWHTILNENIHVELPRGSVWHVPGNRLTGLVGRLYFKMTVSGTEYIPNTPCIFTPNHQSFLDPFLISRFFKGALLKRTYFYAEERHFRKRWLQIFADKANVIIMDLNRDLKQSLQKMATVLRKGKNVLIFPEGARTRDGYLAEFKKTFSILSVELSVPIVPVVLIGAYDAMPKGSHWPKFRQEIQLRFLPPIPPSKGMSYEELTAKVYQQIKAELGDLP